MNGRVTTLELPDDALESLEFAESHMESSKPAISIRGLGKHYANRTGGSGASTTPADEPTWALRGVSFDMHPGEMFALIGRGGAGKSTLLKILSGVTEPDEGDAVLTGRVGSVLDIGAGFNPEMTGRENIFLTGALFGSTRAEIRERFDDIVAFSDVDHFIDMPVSEYASGPMTRLTLAIATHLPCEILIVDDVLAVGDEAFRRKCFGRMRDVAASGRTVLFVSHDLAAVSTLCSRAAWLERGRLAFIGAADEGVDRYAESLAS